MGGKALTTDQFIVMANRIHGNIYNYSKVYYKNNKTKITIICKLHGDFLQRPGDHIHNKQGCPACFGSFLKTRDQFIKDAQAIHRNAYDYSKAEYINNRTKVEIICWKHGSFLQKPMDHINLKQGCPRCVKVGYSKISIQFLNDLAKERKVEIQHAENKGEYIIKDPDFKCLYKCDGYYEHDNKKYIVEFHGNYYHGNPKIYKPDSVCKLRRLTFGELYRKTEERMYRIKALGYEVIYIWEQDYKQYLYDRDNEFFFEGLFEYYRFL